MYLQQKSNHPNECLFFSMRGRSSSSSKESTRYGLSSRLFFSGSFEPSLPFGPFHALDPAVIAAFKRKLCREEGDGHGPNPLFCEPTFLEFTLNCPNAEKNSPTKHQRGTRLERNSSKVPRVDCPGPEVSICCRDSLDLNKPDPIDLKAKRGIRGSWSETNATASISLQFYLQMSGGRQYQT